MRDEDWVTPGNAIWLVICLGLTLIFFNNGSVAADMMGWLFLATSLARTKILVDEWHDVNDPVEAYAPGGEKYVAGPWNTERVADPSQPKPWWIEETA